MRNGRMITDITKMLAEVEERRVQWSLPLASLVAWIIARGELLSTDWDPLSGERWIRLVRSSEVLGLIHVELPLVIAMHVIEEKFPYPAQKLTVSSLSEDWLSCDDGILELAFGPSWNRGALNAARFSANDLWYASI